MASLSLLIPAYNAAAFLPRLLSSAHAQTSPFDEIWVHDDCSTDDTAAVAEAYGARVLRSPVNRGCSAGKNALAQLVETDWMHFHDADDELLPNFVSSSREWMDRNDRDIVLFDYEQRDNETGSSLGVATFDNAKLEADARQYAIATQINPFCGLYRRSAFLAAGGYDEDPLVLYNEDSAFHIRMAFAGLRFSAAREVGVVNYRVSGSMSANNARKCALAQYHVMRRTWERNDAQPFAREIGENLWKVSGILASVGAWKESRAASTLAATVHPPTARVGKLWFRALASLNPAAAVRVREAAIRWLKPHLRTRPG